MATDLSPSPRHPDPTDPSTVPAHPATPHDPVPVAPVVLPAEQEEAPEGDRRPD